MDILRIAEDFCKRNEIDPMKLGAYSDRKEALTYVYIRLSGVNQIYHNNGRDVKRVIEFLFNAFYAPNRTELEVNRDMQIVLNGTENTIGILPCVDFVKNHKHFLNTPKHMMN